MSRTPATTKSKQVATGTAVALPQPTSFAEITRAHRTALSTLKGSFVLTASRGSEGVSLIAHLMASKSAQNGQRTLLIDLNMRDSILSQNLNLERQAWNLPQREVGDLMNDLIVPVEGLENLYAMAAPLDEDSLNFLHNIPQTQAFFAGLEKQFHQVIVDTTPVGALNRGNVDPVLLAAAARRTLLVMMAGKTPKDRIRRALSQLEEAGAQVTGILVNDLHNPDLKKELLNFVGGIKKVAPGLHSWLAHKIRNSELIQ